MYTLIFLLLAVFCLYIGIWSFIKWDSSWLRNLDTLPVRFLLILAGVILLLAAFLLIRRLLKNLEEKNLRRLAVLCILILAAGQLIFLFVFRPMLRYDPLKTFDMAVEMLQTRTISGTYETGYFARYINNYPITILTYWFSSPNAKRQNPFSCPPYSLSTLPASRALSGWVSGSQKRPPACAQESFTWFSASSARSPMCGPDISIQTPVPCLVLWESSISIWSFPSPGRGYGRDSQAEPWGLSWFSDIN